LIPNFVQVNSVLWIKLIHLQDYATYEQNSNETKNRDCPGLSQSGITILSNLTQELIPNLMQVFLLPWINLNQLKIKKYQFPPPLNLLA